MPDLRQPSALHRVGAHLRLIAALLIAGLRRGRNLQETDAALSRLARGTQVAVVAACLGGLALASVAAASFGPIGLLVFWMAIILLVR